MIFTSDQARRIQRGDRTTIRVPVDTRLTAQPLRPATRGQTKPFQPKKGMLILIQQPVRRPSTAYGLHARDGWETVCYAEITGYTRGPFGTLTVEEAQAEGYPDHDMFVRAWVERYDRAWLDRQIDQLITAGVPQDEALETRSEWAKARYQHKWMDREAWTLTIRVQHDLSHVLAPSGGQPKGESGYVLGARDVLDAGIVPPVALLDQGWARRAARRQLEALAENASPAERSRRARALARRVRELALQDPRLTRRIEELVRDAEQDAA